MNIDERLESLANAIERLGQKTDERLDRLGQKTDERLDRLGQKIDERLDRLAERQESLSQAVELLAHMQQKTEKEIRRLGRYVRVIVIDHEERLLELEGEDEDDQEGRNGDGASH